MKSWQWEQAKFWTFRHVSQLFRRTLCARPESQNNIVWHEKCFVVRRLRKCGYHRLWVVDNERRPVGIISLTDIFQNVHCNRILTHHSPQVTWLSPRQSYPKNVFFVPKLEKKKWSTIRPEIILVIHFSIFSQQRNFFLFCFTHRDCFNQQTRVLVVEIITHWVHPHVCVLSPLNGVLFVWNNLIRVLVMVNRNLKKGHQPHISFASRSYGIILLQS